MVGSPAGTQDNAQSGRGTPPESQQPLYTGKNTVSSQQSNNEQMRTGTEWDRRGLHSRVETVGQIMVILL